MFREVARNIVDFLTNQKFDTIIFPSKVALEAYEKYSMVRNTNCKVFPLIFPDLHPDDAYMPQRRYFSFIGLFTALHGNDNYIKLLHYLWENEIFVPCKIATSNNVDYILNDKIISQMIDSGQLVVVHGKPMSIDEINTHYAESVCVWNAYKKSMQSGVIGNAFMMGTPVIASRVGNFVEVLTHGETGFFIESSDKFEQYVEYYNEIKEKQIFFTENCRKAFIDKFFFQANVGLFEDMFRGA